MTEVTTPKKTVATRLSHPEKRALRKKKHPKRYADLFKAKNISKRTICLTEGKIPSGKTGVATRAEISANPKSLQKVSKDVIKGEEG